MATCYRSKIFQLKLLSCHQWPQNPKSKLHITTLYKTMTLIQQLYEFCWKPAYEVRPPRSRAIEAESIPRSRFNSVREDSHSDIILTTEEGSPPTVSDDPAFTASCESLRFLRFPRNCTRNKANEKGNHCQLRLAKSIKQLAFMFYREGNIKDL